MAVQGTWILPFHRRNLLVTPNTICASKSCVVLSYSNHVIDAFGFHLSFGTSISIATVATVAVDLMGQEIE